MTAFASTRKGVPALNWPALPRISPIVMAFAASTVFFTLLTDALVHEQAFFDVEGLKQAQRIDGPFVQELFDAVNALTSSQGAVLGWLATLGFVLYRRWWVAAMAVAVLPIGGVLNFAVGEVVGRTRPEGDEFVRTVGTVATSFPSGHVMGAVMLYGLLFALAGRLDGRAARTGLRFSSLAVILLVGPARLWEGAHWPTDVLAAYALGELVLAGLLAVYWRVEAAAGHLPLIRQGWMPHNALEHHAHALTSIVVFNGETVSKTYTPGLLPRAIYWASFQAPFPYVANQTALEAAAARRNMAALLTEYWYGVSRVARVTGIDEIAGSLALTSEFVRGHEPEDRKDAKAFLKTLFDNFEAAGLPTWQIDPRQPRAVDNVLETADGRYMIVDLESGLVSPLASFKTWRRGIRRGMVPLFDSVFFDITRSYVAANEQDIRALLGDEKYGELLETMELAEGRQGAWYAGEPRLVGRFVGGFWSGWNYRAWPRRLAAVSRRGEASATERLHRAITLWEAQGRVNAAQAGELRQTVESAEMKAAMPHLGAHAALTLALRFPLGSIARAGWTLGALAIDTGRLALRRISLGQWKRSWSMHAPLVLALSLIPGFGAMSYLAARPVRRNRLLLRAVLDMLLMKVPGRLYERSGLRRVVARPVVHDGSITESAPLAA